MIGYVVGFSYIVDNRVPRQGGETFTATFCRRTHAVSIGSTGPDLELLWEALWREMSAFR